MNDSRPTNRLASESSPYLQQHKYNPVDWYPWGEEAWERAREENKPVLISIGYSACHWCHVMEHHCFENVGLAAIMNEHFINIKVDREERPDVDHIYMEAVQLMTGRGGWPLNCFTLPDGRPIYGGTYFPPDAWEKVLISIHELYTTQPEKVEGYAQQLTEGIQQKESTLLQEERGDAFDLNEIAEQWRSAFDPEYGGERKAPKFPMPCNLLFQLHYGHSCNNNTFLDHVRLTLDQMMLGGIYDQVRGGFYRYSVDGYWHVPHFEKMLYDNAQLVSVYSEAYRKWKDPHYARVVRETIAFVNRELKNEKGLIGSALDADSEGEEGRYYVWERDSLQKILSGPQMEWMQKHFGLDQYSHWEGGKNVLRWMQLPAHEDLVEWEKIRVLLVDQQAERIRPGMDDKVLTSWNALWVKALIDAALALEDESFKSEAIHLYQMLYEHMRVNGKLIHCHRAEQQFVPAFSDDLAFMAKAGVGMYELTRNEKYLKDAVACMDELNREFLDPDSPMYYFTSAAGHELIARKPELFDNVIPASNSVIAEIMLILSQYFNSEERQTHAKEMLHQMWPWMRRNAAACGHWMQVQWLMEQGKEVAITGKGALDLDRELRQHYLPNAVVAASDQKESSLDLLESRLKSDEPAIHVCHHNTCNLPVNNVEQALKLIHPQA